jgi:DNA (cytosine-5)-methyltransferase 1
VGRLRAYGNAIVPQVAAEVIGAYMDCYPDPDEQLRAALATN